MTDDDRYDVAIVGGGPAGLSAAIFTARHDFDTVLLDDGGSILRRNANLENYPGFPAGIDARLLLEMMGEQAERAGCERRTATVTRLDHEDAGFALRTDAGESIRSTYVVAATKNEVGYLEHLEGIEVLEPGKTYVATDRRGRTGVDGLYAAGRLARKPHQTVVCAGHGAEVAVTLLEDDERGFYHDWVAPAGYFTGRDRDVPPGCEEIPEAEWEERERDSRDVLSGFLVEPHDGEPQQHPSVADEG